MNAIGSEAANGEAGVETKRPADTLPGGAPCQSLAGHSGLAVGLVNYNI